MDKGHLLESSSGRKRTARLPGPKEVLLADLADTRRIADEIKLLGSLIDSSAGFFLFARGQLVPLDIGSGGVFQGSELCRALESWGGCTSAHWRAAEQALAAGRPVSIECPCGAGLVYGWPIVLSYSGKRYPKGAATAAFFEPASPSVVAEKTGVAEEELRSLLAEAERRSLEPKLRNQVIQAIEAITGHLSNELSAAYSFYRSCHTCSLAEASLRKEKRKLQNLLRGLGAALIVHDASMKISWVNDVAQEWFGPRAELIGRRCIAAQEPGTVCPERSCELARETGQIQRCEFAVAGPDGDIRYYQVTASPVFNGFPRERQVLELIQDVTAQANARQRLEDYRRLFDNVDDFVALTDGKGNLLTVNRKIREKLGYTEAELVGANIDKLFLEEDLPKAWTLAHEAQANDTAKGEVRLVSRDGRVFETELLLSYSKADGTLQGIFRDVSERRQMERELRERARQIEEQNHRLLSATREKERFFASVSHELRTPMTSIIGFTELLLEDTEDPLTPGQRAQLEKVAQNAHRMLMLVNDLLDLSKIEAGKMSLNLERVELPVLVTQVVTNMEPLVHNKPVKLKTDVAWDLPKIRTDEQKLGQILVNLLSNAIKFTDKGWVTVSARAAGNKVNISVTDTGVGIKPADVPKVFEAFEQLHAGKRSGQAGTGLGLTIAQKLAHLLGGEISVQSKPGKGSTFTVALPLNARRVRSGKGANQEKDGKPTGERQHLEVGA